MIDVNPFMPILNEMIVTGDALVKPSCWSVKLALESYVANVMTSDQVLEMVIESKNDLDSAVNLSGDESNYSIVSTYTVLNQIIEAFTEN